MTRRELAEWITENGAEDMEVFFLTDDGTLVIPKPEVAENKEVKELYWDARLLDENGRSVIL